MKATIRLSDCPPVCSAAARVRRSIDAARVIIAPMSSIRHFLIPGAISAALLLAAPQSVPPGWKLVKDRKSVCQMAVPEAWVADKIMITQLTAPDKKANALMGDEKVRPIVAPAISLAEAAFLLARARVVVGVDTGLLHLAAALDTPTVGLFSATPRWRYAPYWSPHAINLGSYGELGAQPSVSAVVEALERLHVIEAGTSAAMIEKEATVFHIARSRGSRAR